MVLESFVRTNLLDKENIDSDEVSEAIHDILIKHPLSDNALFLYAQNPVVSEKSGREKIQIHKVIMERNPRNRENLRAVLADAIRSGDLNLTIDTLDLLYKLQGKSTQDLVIETLSSLYSLPEGRNIIDERLSQIPAWGWRFLRFESLSSAPENIAWVMRSLEVYLKSTPEVISLFPQIDVVSRKLIDVGDINSAHELWKFSTAQAGSLSEKEGTLNFNPQIQELDSPPPFDWFFPKNNGVTIEQSQDQTFVSFKGSKKLNVASQFFIPAAEAKKLILQANYDYSEQKGSFLVSIDCLALNRDAENAAILTDKSTVEGDVVKQNQKNENLYTLRLDNRFESGERHELQLDGFDPLCKLASLSIIAEPGVFNERLSATFNYLGVMTENISREGQNP